MLQAHSFLWNYLWVAPNLLLLVLALLLWRRGYLRQLPAFLAFAIISGVGDLLVFLADVAPRVSALTYWRVGWAVLVLETLVKFAVIGEVFSKGLLQYPSISRLGRMGVSGFGAAIVFVAAMVAAFSRKQGAIPIIAEFHILQQTVFLVELAVILCIFLFVAYFRLSWPRLSFGVMLGFGVSSCAFLAAWAVMVNANLSEHGRTLLDFFNMTAHHLCVVIWFYYVVVPKSAIATAPRVPKHNLELWNRELERLLQQ